MAISLLAYVATFSKQLYFWRNYFFILLQSNCFDTKVTFSEYLFLQRCYFFGGSFFLRTVTSLRQSLFLEYLLFQSKTSTKQPLLENRQFFRAGTFRNADLFGGETGQNKDIFRRVTFSQHTFSKEILFHSYYCTSCLLVSNYVTSIVRYSESLGVLSYVAIIAQSASQTKFIISRLHKVLWNCYFLSKLPFKSL